MATKPKAKYGGGSPHLYFILPALMLVGVVLAFPIAYSLGISLFRWHLVDVSQRGFVWFRNYIDLLYDPEFWHSLQLQAGFIFIAIPIELIIGFFVAILLNREFPGARTVRTLLLLPVFVLPVLSGLTWRFIFMPEYGPVSFVFGKFGMKFPAFFADPYLAYTAVVIQDIWRMWPFMFMVLYAGLTTIPDSLLEAADMDGATIWDKLVKIYIPMLYPTIVTALLLRLIDALRIFSEVFVMTEGGPGNATTLFSIYVHRQAFRYFNIGTASSMAIVLLVLTLIFAMALVRKNMDIDEM